MTLSYELAKELKDAGFPQMGNGFALVLHELLSESDQTMSVIPYFQFVFLHKTGHEWVYAPTLDELIEACGGKNLKLVSDYKGYCWATSSLYATSGDGETFIEAVARLYLSLQRDRIGGNDKRNLQENEGNEEGIK